MATKSIFLRPHSLPTTFLSPRHPFPKSLISITTSAVVGNLSFSTLPYGPSLHKGHLPNPLKLANPPSVQDTTTNNNVMPLDEDAFTRVFDISALRVPSDLCFTLETRLRGHLLNWPRIKNIARVPGDEIDNQFRTLLPKSDVNDDSGTLVTFNRRIYGKDEGDGQLLSPVLYRDKLARAFNSKGFVKFRNLAKISRPKKKKKKAEVDSYNGNKREKREVGRNEMALLEVVTEEEDNEGEDLGSLLGEEFKAKKWRGADQAVLEEHGGQSTMSEFELVKCKLTLFYNYWQQNEILEVLLPKGMIIPSAFETVGHIAHLNLRDEHLPLKNLIAKVVLDKSKPKIQTVVNKIDAIHNDYRTMQLEVLAGNRSLVTTVVENGLRFQVDLAAVYWNSRLATERQRLLCCFTRDDVVCDVFAGVGPIAISAAKKVKHVYANDLNPCAVDYLERNCILNKLERKIEVFNMDGRRFIEAIFASQRAQSITQVVMNLPNDCS
ncbi:tRNA (guanine(37)-N1)-methyltransferase 2 [Abeliophyllum distichum]|uniref:tRNA (Guanine(37)-N1)-methyltransferase 2 n=1 Tax=Abeliophyllum distichum TaxID=126358 RepID=A0ABD1UGF1_9LAMI